MTAQKYFWTPCRQLCVLLILIFATGCTTVVVNSFVDPTMENLQRQTDLNLVCEGAPAFLLIIDSLIVSNPNSTRMLMTGTQAYVAYVTALTECGSSKERLAKLSEKARDYGIALLSQFPLLREHINGSPTAFENSLMHFNKRDVPSLFWGGYGWATSLQYQGASPAAVAELPKVEMLMRKVLELDDTYYMGAAHLFMGVYFGSRPAMLGGDPQKSLDNFEQALKISNREFLPVQVAFAETYAKMQFDRTLYEKLLKEVIDFPLEKRQEFSLSNQVAKKRAERLLAEADTFF